MLLQYPNQGVGSESRTSDPDVSTRNEGTITGLYFGQLTLVEYDVSLGVPMDTYILVFRSGRPLTEIFWCLVFLDHVFEIVTFFGFTEEWGFTDVIEGSLLRIGLTLQTLLSVS